MKNLYTIKKAHYYIKYIKKINLNYFYYLNMILN